MTSPHDTARSSDVNFVRYPSPSVVNHYSGARGLHRAESHFIDPG